MQTSPFQERFFAQFIRTVIHPNCHFQHSPQRSVCVWVDGLQENSLIHCHVKKRVSFFKPTKPIFPNLLGFAFPFIFQHPFLVGVIRKYWVIEHESISSPICTTTYHLLVSNQAFFLGAAGSRVDIGRRSRVESAELRFGKETMLIVLVIENDLESEKNKSHATSRSIFRVDMRYMIYEWKVLKTNHYIYHYLVKVMGMRR